MIICAAQTKPTTGNIEQNIRRHRRLLEQTAGYNVDMVTFPELSLTGYEPELAEELATTEEDPRLAPFQSISDERNLTIGVGLPLASPGGVQIGMVIFRPHKKRKVYTKQHLHADELPYFIAGTNDNPLLDAEIPVAPAICYEISVPVHAQRAHQAGAEVYAASVAKFESGIAKAERELSQTARRYAMPVLMANSIGICDGQRCAGQSSAWNSNAQLIARLNNTDEGLLIIDTDSEEAITETL